MNMQYVQENEVENEVEPTLRDSYVLMKELYDRVTEISDIIQEIFSELDSRFDKLEANLTSEN